jgi:ArsR family transcriptional regulator
MRLRTRGRAERGGELLSLGESMKLVQIYQCFCDQTRLRILHLLTQTPLCVCHFQDVLDEPQVKVSKHLAYLRSRGLVQTRRSGNWIVYSLPSKRSAELETNLQCLQDCVASDPTFRKDLKRLAQLQSSCCEPVGVFGKAIPALSNR